MNLLEFYIPNLDGMDIIGNTSHQNQDLSFDTTTSPPKPQGEELDKRKRKQKHTKYGINNHFND